MDEGRRTEGGDVQKDVKGLFIEMWEDWWEKSVFLGTRACSKAALLWDVSDICNYFAVSSSWLIELWYFGDYRRSILWFNNLAWQVPYFTEIWWVGKGKVRESLSFAKDSTRSLNIGIFYLTFSPQVARIITRLTFISITNKSVIHGHCVAAADQIPLHLLKKETETFGK